jgi:hypothetical protein
MNHRKIKKRYGKVGLGQPQLSLLSFHFVSFHSIPFSVLLFFEVAERKKERKKEQDE